jgi:hypothetical protein
MLEVKDNYISFFVNVNNKKYININMSLNNTGKQLKEYILNKNNIKIKTLQYKQYKILDNIKLFDYNIQKNDTIIGKTMTRFFKLDKIIYIY